MLNVLSVGAGGFFGAILRYLVGLIPVKEPYAFPIKTFFINVIGCVMIGVLVLIVGKHTAIDERWMLFLKVGICGGFTTFSTFALETSELISGGQWLVAVSYVVMSVVVGVGVIVAIDVVLK